MRRVGYLALLCLCAPLAWPSDQPYRQLGDTAPDIKARWLGLSRVRHEVLIDAPQTQKIDITVTVTGNQQEFVDFALPAWRPGRYQILDFSGSVTQVRAENGAGAPLTLEKRDKGVWRVASGGAAEVRLRYRVYCAELAERARHVDDTHAFLSGSAVFMQALGLRDTPQRVVIRAPHGWTVTSGLDAVEGAENELIAPNYDVLIDAPLEIGTHTLRSFEVQGKPFELAIWGDGPYEVDRLARDLATLSRAQMEFWGDAPFGRYVYLLHVGAGASGGTEHLNSTIMQVSPNRFSAEKEYRKFLSLASHEFFHTWNVKALRPSGISPYDYQRENYTDLLWVAEGATSYYEDLLLARAGLIKPEHFLKNTAEMLDEYYRRPGKGVQSVAAAGFDAWTMHSSPDGDAENSTVSFYREGALVTLVLDIELRRRTDLRVSFDDVLRALYSRFPLGGPGYSQADAQALCAELSATDFAGFFERYITGAEEYPLADAFSFVGIELLKEAAEPDESEESDSAAQPATASAPTESAPSSAPAAPAPRAYLGIETTAADGLAKVTVVRADGPAHVAGVQVGDLLVALNGRRVRADELKARLRECLPGAEATLSLLRRDQLRELRLTLLGKPDVKHKLKHMKSPTPEQMEAYAAWMGQPWPVATSMPAEEK